MTLDTNTWAPPRGSTEVEPGYWMAPNGSVYSDPKAHEPTEEEKQFAKERARVERANRIRHHASLVPELVERIQDLELQCCLLEMFLDTACLMLSEEKKQVVFLDDLIAGLVLEIPGAVA